MTRTILILIALVLTRTAPALAQASPQDPKTVIETNTEAIRGLVLASNSQEEMREKVRGLLEKFIDFPQFGRLCLGDMFESLTPEQKEVYLEEFKNLLRRTYLRRFKPGKEFTVTYHGETLYNASGDRAQVKTTIQSGDAEADVEYRLSLGEDGWEVYDLVIDEVSVRRNYRKSFTKVLEKDGFDKLLGKMRNKNSEEEEE